MEEVAKPQLSLLRGQREPGGNTEGRERQAARPGLDTNPAWPRHCCSLQLPCWDLLVHAGPTETCGYQGTRGMAWGKTGGEPALWRRAQPGVQSHRRAPSSTTLELRDISIIHLHPACTAGPGLEPVPRIPGHHAMVSRWLPAQVHLPASYVSFSACMPTQLPTDTT